MGDERLAAVADRGGYGVVATIGANGSSEDAARIVGEATYGRMLTLLRSRGYATVGSDDWTTVRLIVGTAGRTPTWPPASDAPCGTDGRPRVLVEVPVRRTPSTPATRVRSSSWSTGSLASTGAPGPVKRTFGPNAPRFRDPRCR